MKKVIVLLVLFNATLVFAQEHEFGKLTPFESEFKTYQKDTTAHAVYLYEKGDNSFEIRGNYVWLIKEYHAKIKILDKQGISEADISIPYYHSDNARETVDKIRAITHNGTVKHSLR